MTSAWSGRLMRKRNLQPIERGYGRESLKRRYEASGVAEDDRALANTGLSEYARALAATEKEE